MIKTPGLPDLPDTIHVQKLSPVPILVSGVFPVHKEEIRENDNSEEQTEDTAPSITSKSQCDLKSAGNTMEEDITLPVSVNSSENNMEEERRKKKKKKKKLKEEGDDLPPSYSEAITSLHLEKSLFPQDTLSPEKNYDSGSDHSSETTSEAPKKTKKKDRKKSPSRTEDMTSTQNPDSTAASQHKSRSRKSSRNQSSDSVANIERVEREEKQPSGDPSIEDSNSEGEPLTRTKSEETVIFSLLDSPGSTPEMVQNEVALKFNKARMNVFNELLETEKVYVRDLGVIVDLFVIPLREKRTILDSASIQSIFSNIEVIVKINRAMLSRLEARNEEILNNPSHSDWVCGDIFLGVADFFKIYAAYCNNQSSSATQTLAKAMQQPR